MTENHLHPKWDPMEVCLTNSSVHIAKTGSICAYWLAHNTGTSNACHNAAGSMLMASLISWTQPQVIQPVSSTISWVLTLW